MLFSLSSLKLAAVGLAAGLAFAGNLKDFTVAAAPTPEDGLKFLEEKKNEGDVVQLPSGLLYKVLRKGEGKHHPTVSSPCSCHYEGTLIDGTKFDSSYDRGEPTTFAPNQVGYRLSFLHHFLSSR
tara:strand:- start:3058 stop:3432 length:375 start_codon:yes stop_codon:yes gene_type:complete